MLTCKGGLLQEEREANMEKSTWLRAVLRLCGPGEQDQDSTGLPLVTSGPRELHRQLFSALFVTGETQPTQQNHHSGSACVQPWCGLQCPSSKGLRLWHKPHLSSGKGGARWAGPSSHHMWDAGASEAGRTGLRSRHRPGSVRWVHNLGAPRKDPYLLSC